jgi:hypothetical protein
VVRARSRLHPDHTRRQLREKRQQIGATQTTPENGMGGSIDTVHLENRLGEIEANRDDGLGSSSSFRLCGRGRAHAPTSGRRTGAVHAIKWLLQHRYMQIEGMAELTPPLIDADPAKLPPMAA